MNITEPTIIERPARPYLAIRRSVTMPEIGVELPPLSARVFEYLRAQGIAPIGAFWRYAVIDMARELDMEIGEQLDAPIAEVPDEFVTGELPGGRYASLTHVGHPQELADATKALLDWGNDQGVTWDRRIVDGVEHWGARLELYETDPSVEPDMTKWQTTLAFRLAG